MDPIESIPEVEEPVEESMEEPVEQPTKAKKKLSEDRLSKLAKARARASEVAKQKRELKKNPLPAEDPIVVIEQSESDEDQFEGPPGVLFVRRRRHKTKEPTIPPEMAMLYASMFGTRSNY